MSADDVREDAMSLGDFVFDRTLALASGGKVRLVVEGQIGTMGPRDRSFVLAMMGNVERYAEEHGEDAFFDDGT
jgi:hypothetical protein